jgi:hypothetical protein
MGYHTREIKKGEYGKSSKILEEIEELIDSESQQNKIMTLVELSDIVGAIEGYLESNYPGFAMKDLVVMARSTKSAFEDGSRT